MLVEHLLIQKSTLSLQSLSFDWIFESSSSHLILGVKSFFTRSKYKNAPSVASKAIHTPLHHLIGRFQQLKSMKNQHPHLCNYIDVIKGKHDQVFIISEHYTLSLREYLTMRTNPMKEEEIRCIIFEILDALVFLNKHQMVHRKLTLDNILIDDEGRIKLSDYGMYHMTKFGSLVRFPIGDPRYLAPETIAEGIVFTDSSIDSPKSDVWSIGIIMFELMTSGNLPWPQTSTTPFKILLEILSLIGHEIHIDLQAQKLEDLEKADLETLRLKMSGLLNIKPSNLNSTTSNSSTSSTSTNSQEKSSNVHKMLQQKERRQLDILISSLTPSQTYSDQLKEILYSCLVVDPLQRYTPAELIRHYYFDNLKSISSAHWFPRPFTLSDALSLPKEHPVRNEVETQMKAKKMFFQEEAERKSRAMKQRMLMREQEASGAVNSSSSNQHQTSQSSSTPAKEAANSAQLHQDSIPPSLQHGTSSTSSDYNLDTDPVNNITLEDLFHIWAQGSGDIDGELAPDLKISPPILRIPLFVTSNQSAEEIVSDHDSKLIVQHRGSKDESRRYTDKIIAIPVETLCYLAERNSNFTTIQWMNMTDKTKWPLDIREKDLEYQAQRICTFRKLFQFYPETRNQIIRQARIDIPPILRAEIWAAILNVPAQNIRVKTYNEIDKDSEGAADRQIDLDVPRCHQYHELLSSPEGHYKLKRVLKAWVKHNPQWGYWQGVDSFLAPFLVQNFNNEPLAFWCLQKAVEKFSRKLFDREHAVYLQEHLQIFKQMLSYHDPKLSMHLHHIGFQPALYAIPWFLTLFTQFFSLDQIARLWDRVLHSSSQLPFYLAFSMMRQLRDIILPLDFNNCIFLFSSLPGVDIDLFIKGAELAERETPPSITMPNYSDNQSLPNEKWWDRQIPLEELQTENFPRLSVIDLLTPDSPFVFLILDIRDTAAAEAMPIVGAVHVLPSNFNNMEFWQKTLQGQRGKHIVIVGDRYNEGRQLANDLIEMEVPRVSVLNGGIDAIVTEMRKLQ